MNFKRFFAVVKARNLEFFRDRSSLGWNILFPVLMLAGLSFVFSGDGRGVYKVGVINLPTAQSSFIETKHIDFVDYNDVTLATTKLEHHAIDLLVDFTLEKYWVNEGFPAVGDDIGKGCESLVHQISTRYGFVKNPIGIARNIWQKRGKPVTNSCVPRSAAIGLIDDLGTVFKLTERFCLVTHPDPRNVASCVMISFLIFTFTHHDVPKNKIEDVIGLAIHHGKQVLSHKKHRSQLEKYCYSSLKDLQLRKEAVSDFTFRSLGCGIWALRYAARTKNQKNLFTRIIKNIVLEGGDADCNASTAGALLGACLGFKKLPKKWLNGLPNRNWLDQLIEKFVKVRFNEEVEDENEDYSIEESEEYSSSYPSSSSDSDSEY